MKITSRAKAIATSVAYVFSIGFTTVVPVSVPAITPVVSAASHCEPNDSTLGGYWPFEEGSGTTTADESSSNSNDGTLMNGPTWEMDTPTLSYTSDFSLDFDGVDDFVDIGSPSSLKFDSGDTFSGTAWINGDSLSGFQTIFHKIEGINTDRKGYLLTMNDNKPEVWIISDFGGGDYLRVASNSTIGTGAWHQIGFTYDGTSSAAGVTIYIDGSAVADTDVHDNLTGSIDHNEEFEIGGRSVQDLQYFDGMIDDVRIYDRELESGEVGELFGGACVDSGAVPECDAMSTFDLFSLGSVNGQGGWSATGPFDQEVVTNNYGFPTFGCQSLRISNAITSGSFGDQTFSFSATNEAGETAAVSGGYSSGTRQNSFVAEFDIAATQSTEQTDLFLSISPDRGDGARMSYLSFEDTAGGFDVTFYDVQGTSNPANFVPTVVATDLSRTEPHTIKFDMLFLDGESNDVVKIYIDGALVHTGTSWENYYVYDSEQAGNGNEIPTTDSLIFRASGTAIPANSGNGYLIDNVDLETETFAVCDGQLATIYVDGSNNIVGGPDDGNPYAGTLNGTSGADVILGTSGDDTINGYEGADIICAEGGNDTVAGNEGADTVYGGDGDDYISTGKDDDTIYGEDGADEIYGRKGNDTIYGGDGADEIYGNEGEDYIEGGNGADTIQGNEDDDVLKGNKGADMVCGNEGNDEVRGGDGADTLCGGDGDDDMYGGKGADSIDGNDGTDTIDGKDGSDICVNGESLSNCEDTGTPVIACQKGFTLDYGDAPDPTFPTLFDDDGARHKVGSVFLGSTVDSENNGQPSAGADGDDTDGTDDEDGVTFDLLYAGIDAEATVVASTGGYLDAWVDFNNDGDWDELNEHIFDDEVLVAGSNDLEFAIPEGATVNTNVAARFRFSSTTVADFRGQQEDGEVEDYVLYIEELGSLTVTKYTFGDNDEFDIELSGDASDTSSITTVNGSGSYTFEDLIPGTYHVSEDADDQWYEAYNDCEDIDVTAGNDSTCVIINTLIGSLEVYKSSISGTDEFDFAIDINNDDYDFDIETTSPSTETTDSDAFFDIYFDIDGSYDGSSAPDENDLVQVDVVLTEYEEAGWRAISVECDGFDDYDSDYDDEDLVVEGFMTSPGQEVECLYTNEPTGFDAGDDDDDGDDHDHDPVGTIPYCDGQIATIYVNSGGLIVGGPMDGLPYNNVLIGSDGDDVIVGTGNEDYVDAKDGNDLVCGGHGDDILNGDLGDDVIYGDGGYDRIFGGDGEDELYGESASDIIFGGDAPDIIDGGDGVDYCDGGPGIDSVTGCGPFFNPSFAGAIIIEKVVNAGSDVSRDFNFQVTEGADIDFALDDDLADQTLPDVFQFAAYAAFIGGTEYVITEEAVDGWRVSNIECTGDSNVVIDIENRKVTIDLDDDEEVHCTFYNEGTGGNGGANGFRWRRWQTTKKLNNLSNPRHVNVPTAPAGFGGPEYFGTEGEELTWEQLSAVCTVHDNLEELETLDIVELMAENFAHVFGVSEEFILDIIQNGTYCNDVYSARAEDERIEQELIAAEEARKHAELIASYYPVAPKTVEVAMGEDGYPVSTDMIWNACIRRVEVYLPGEDKPVSCRRFHEGHTWTHPDTHLTFNWSDRIVKKLEVHGALVATYTVPTPDLYNSEFVVVNDKSVRRLVLSTAKYMAIKGSDILKQLVVNGPEEEIETAVLSEQTTTAQ